MPWYTWTFSGIGVLLVSVVGTVVWAWLARKREASRVTGSPAKQSLITALGSDIPRNDLVSSPTRLPEVSSSLFEYHDSPTPKEIWAHLATLPSFQQLKIRETYEGLRVRWAGYLSHLAPVYGKDDEFYVYMTTSAKTDKSEFDCTVKITDFPRLKIAKSGDPIVVTGTIRGVGGAHIGLEDAHLDFLEPRDMKPPRNRARLA